MFNLTTLPREYGQLILVTDRVQSPAEFVLHQVIASHLREPGARVIIASCLEGLAHWKATSAKMSPGLNLASRIAAGSVVFLDELGQMTRSEQPLPDNQFRALKSLYEKLDKAMEGGSEFPTAPIGLLVLDGLSTFEWMGVPASQLKLFVRAAFALCAKRKYALLIRHHKLGDDGTDEMLRLYLQLSSIHLEVLPLSTGRSGAVSGEVNVLCGASLVKPLTDSWEGTARTKAVQYRLLDTGPTFFERGSNNAGVL